MDRDKAIEILRDMALPELGYTTPDNEAAKAGADALVRLHSLEQEVAEARKDSRRLDWLGAHPRLIVASTGYRGSKDSWCWRDQTSAFATHEAETLRAAIDAAMED